MRFLRNGAGVAGLVAGFGPGLGAGFGAGLGAGFAAGFGAALVGPLLTGRVVPVTLLSVPGRRDGWMVDAGLVGAAGRGVGAGRGFATGLTGVLGRGARARRFLAVFASAARRARSAFRSNFGAPGSHTPVGPWSPVLS